MATPSASRFVKFGDFVADLDSFELRKHGIRLKLQDQPFQLLRLLLLHPGRVVTREELRVELWAEDTFVDFDAGLNAAIHRIRDALSDSAEEPRYIETLPRHGYRFIAPVEIVTEFAPKLSAGVPTASGNVHGKQDPEVWAVQGGVLVSKQPRAWQVSWPTKFFAACVLLVVVGAGAVVLRSRVIAKHAGNGHIYSIAVLPLENLSGDPSQSYFADGMTDALITNLAQIKSLQVTSRTSSMRFKGVHKSLPQVAHELNVGLIVEGSVIRLGDRVSVSAELIDAAKDQHLWARRYDRNMKDVLQLQSELASAIATEVVGSLAPDEQARLSTPTRPVNPHAYGAYLRGEYLLDRWTSDSFDRAKFYFQQSIDLDPSFAQAYAGLAEYYLTVAITGLAPRQEAWIKTEDLLTRALEIDHSSSKAHTLLGIVKLQFRCDSAAAEKELAYALALNPGEMNALDYHSYYLLEIGRSEEALAEKEKVLQHDPLSVRINAELGLYLFQAGRTDEAIAQLQKTVELDPNYAATHMRLGWAYTRKKEYDRAAVEIQKAIVLDKRPMRLAKLGEVYALWGKRRQAMHTIEQLREMSKRRYVASPMIALVYARLGEKESAIAWLEKAKRDDDPKISDPAFKVLQPDPRFKALEARLRPGSSCPAF